MTSTPCSKDHWPRELIDAAIKLKYEQNATIWHKYLASRVPYYKRTGMEKGFPSSLINWQNSQKQLQF